MYSVVTILIFLIPSLKIGSRELPDWKVYPFRLLYRIFFIFLRLNEKEEQLIRSRLIRISQFHVHFKDLHYDEENDKCDRVGYIAECL